MLKKIKEDINKWKHILCSWIGRLNIIKISIIAKEIYRLNAIPIKISVFFFFFFFFFFINLTKSKAGGLTFPDFKTYWKAIIIIIEGYWHKDRYTDQWNRIKSLGINPCLYSQMTFDKNVKTIQWVEDSSSPSTPPYKWCWENWIST